MSWLIIAIIAYFLLAIVNLFDKFLLDKALPSSRAYTFLVGCLGMMVFVAAPWFLEWPGWGWMLFNLLIGALFPLALLLFYRALKKGEASKVLLLVGGAVPIFTLIFSLGLLNDRFSSQQWIALAFLLAGTVLITWIPEKQSFWHRALLALRVKKKPSTKGLMVALGAAVFYALFFIGSKEAFNNQDFFSSFIWIRAGSFLFVLFLLAHRKSRQEIFGNLSKLTLKKGGLFFGNQGVAAGAFLLQNYAISLTSVALVNALQGVQYVVIIVLGVIATLFTPHILKENISRAVILQKILAVGLVAIGLYFMAYS